MEDDLVILITKAQRLKLHRNHEANAAADGSIDHVPVLKLFTPWGRATWLLSELDPADNDMAFGLCDIAEPELGYVSLSELMQIRGFGGLGIERDRHFYPIKTLSEYASQGGY